MIPIPGFKKRKMLQKNNPKIPYNSKGYYIAGSQSQYRDIPFKVTVITPVYNAEKYLRKTLDSVIRQTIGLSNIEYILVDDGSTDSSRNILFEYSSKFDNILSVFLKKNTGTPGQPRNIGIQLSTGKYITFLDADDWLDENGLEVLYSILDKTGDDYAVGKTIQVQSNGTKVVGEQESCMERRSISPFSIPHIFHHLGPRARMVKASIVKDNHLFFPEMKFAEDKQFFIDFFLHCKKISTTKNTIYYLNRTENQETRLTNQTNILQKANCNLKVIQYIIAKNLEEEKEKMILNRLYEFDSISRFFSTPHFYKTKLKFLYYLKLKQILKTTKRLRYDFSQQFFEPIHQVVYKLFIEKNYRDLEKLLEWNKKEKVKNVVIKDALPYLSVPFIKDKYVRIPMHAIFIDHEIYNQKYCLRFKVYGDDVDFITDVLLRSSKDALNEYSLPVLVDKHGNGRLEIDLDFLRKIPLSNYSLFLRYEDYRKINIRKLSGSPFTYPYQSRNMLFYTTSFSNLGIQMKPI
jgi:glycosyltransferase involved in cell wall biosynthesis